MSAFIWLKCCKLFHRAPLTQIRMLDFSISRQSYLFRAFISVPDEAAAAIATLRIHRIVEIWMCRYVGHMWSVFVLLSDRTCSLLMISDLVMATRSPSSTAKAGKEMTDRRPASISFEVEARGSMEHRMDWGGNTRTCWAGGQGSGGRCRGGWRWSWRYLTMLHLIGQNVDDWLRPSVSTEEIQLVYGLQSRLWTGPTHTDQHTRPWTRTCRIRHLLLFSSMSSLD